LSISSLPFQFTFSSDAQKLTINTNVEQLEINSTATPTSPLNQSPLRKRNTYNTTDLGPQFMPSKQFTNVWTSDRSKRVKFAVNGKVDKGFFLADNDWTCYRRNYFQVSGTFACNVISASLPTPTEAHTADFDPSQEAACIVEDNGQYFPVHGYMIGISARIAAGDKKIDLVQHTSKRDKGPQLVPKPRPIRAGGNAIQSQLHRLLASSQLSSAITNQTVATFERIQFKSATANNGKRRAAQQYYVVDVELFAEIDNYENGGTRLVKIASSSSSPLVVRGRSPGHYSDIDRAPRYSGNNWAAPLNLKRVAEANIYGRLYPNMNHNASANSFASLAPADAISRSLSNFEFMGQGFDQLGTMMPTTKDYMTPVLEANTLNPSGFPSMEEKKLNQQLDFRSHVPENMVVQEPIYPSKTANESVPSLVSTADSTALPNFSTNLEAEAFMGHHEINVDLFGTNDFASGLSDFHVDDLLPLPVSNLTQWL
jgi:hypothetical protein